jgi:hypothetical protein
MMLCLTGILLKLRPVAGLEQRLEQGLKNFIALPAGGRPGFTGKGKSNLK